MQAVVTRVIRKYSAELVRTLIVLAEEGEEAAISCGTSEVLELGYGAPAHARGCRKNLDTIEIVG